MKKLFLFIVFIIGSLSMVIYSQVDVDEIRTDEEIRFINYSGPYAYRESVFAIRGIGRRLAKGLEDSDKYNYLLKYSVIHAVDETGDKFNADIISIDEDARVEHIRNIRLILASYLTAKYGYNRKDSATLAFFLTIYNAVYRGNVDYFTSKYNPVVISHITQANAGLSTKYFEWAGATRILIPLSDKFEKGDISSLDTTELSDDSVIEKIREEDDKGISERKDMVKLKEKEVEQKRKETDKERREIAEKKREIKKEEKAVAEKEAAIEEKKQVIAEEKKEAEKIEDEKEREEKLQEIAEKEEEVKKEEAEVEEEKEVIEEEKVEVEKKEEEVVAQEEAIAEKEAEIEKEEEQIKRDETELKIEEDPDKVKEELLEKEEELAEKEKELEEREEEVSKQEIDEKIIGINLYYLKIKEYLTGGHYNNEMYIINASTRKIKLKSPVTNICGRRYDVFADGVIVITREEGSDENYYLTLLDKDSLEAKYLGVDNIFWRSFIEVNNDFIYAIIKGEDGYYLGKFNNKMETVAKSTEKISNDTFISFFENVIYINSSDKNIMVLSQEDLSLEEVIR